MEGVALDEAPGQLIGQGLAQARLAATGHAHDHDVCHLDSAVPLLQMKGDEAIARFSSGPPPVDALSCCTEMDSAILETKQSAPN